MNDNKTQDYISTVIENMPQAWLSLTTHRLDIYNEQLAKTQFLDQFEVLYNSQNATTEALSALPTAYDYIRLGHPLSCVLEWGIAKANKLNAAHIISFSSQTAPILAILRKNLLTNKKTQINYIGALPAAFDAAILQSVYGYHFSLKQVASAAAVTAFEGSNIFLAQQDEMGATDLHPNIDFYIHLYPQLGSIIIAHHNDSYISEIQHVRRRETIAMTPANSLTALKMLAKQAFAQPSSDSSASKASVLSSLKQITGTLAKPLVASSGLSIQYAIMMGLVHHALQAHPGKAIRFIVPPNCYGGTNDQARRVAACIANVAVVDLLVDGDNNMVQSIDTVLADIAQEDAIAYIIAEIPTNPRVEVPDLQQLKAVLSATRLTSTGSTAVDPVFILDQTFCPNFLFLGEGAILSTVRAISYASGSKFPSGGQCTAGYVVGNSHTDALMHKIELHLALADNEATALQYQILAKQLPSMNKRIADAYRNTREFVNFIHETLPTAKINFVSEALAAQGFTPSVFSLDLPTKGNSPDEKESYKRAMNHKLIDMMISQIPNESKYCVSYGQLHGCYWTIPATSTQGTTKEGDKDYIARVALSADMDLELHKKVFASFVAQL